MPANITEVNAYTDPVTIPAAGDPVNAAGWLTALQAVTNRLKYIRTRGIFVAATQKICLNLQGAVGTNFSFVSNGGPGSNAVGWKQTNAAGGNVFLGFWVPSSFVGHSITKVIAYFRPQGSGATHAGLPANQPQVGLRRQPQDAAVLAVVGSDTQLADGSVVAYEAPRSITNTQAHAISAADTYYVAFTGESGANALVDLLLTRVEIEITA